MGQSTGVAAPIAKDVSPDEDESVLAGTSARHPRAKDLTTFERYRMHVDWLERHLDLFTPASSTLDAEAEITQIQRHGELALAFRTRHCVEENAEFGAATSWDTWLRAIIRHLESPAVRERSRSRLATAHAWLMPYVVLRSLGLWQDDWHDATLAIAEKAGFPLASEVVPYRRADQLFFLGMRGQDRAADLQGAIGATYLASGPSVIHADRDAAYSVTHTVLYASSFGLETVRAEWPFLSAAVAFAESALVRFCRRRDWDLVGELLICLNLLPGADRVLIERAESCFMGAIREDGGVFASEATAKAVGAMSPLTRSADFDATYHTTLVAMFLAANPRTRAAVAPVDRGGVLQEAFRVRVLGARQRAITFLGEPSRADEAARPSSPAILTWDDVLTGDRLGLTGALAASVREVDDPVIVIRLAQSLAAERDYGNLIRALGWVDELSLWNEDTLACLQLLLDHQTPDGRIGLLSAELEYADEATSASVYRVLTSRFVALCDSLLVSSPVR